jgi:hypothetical protein
MASGAPLVASTSRLGWGKGDDTWLTRGAGSWKFGGWGWFNSWKNAASSIYYKPTYAAGSLMISLEVLSKSWSRSRPANPILPRVSSSLMCGGAAAAFFSSGRQVWLTPDGGKPYTSLDLATTACLSNHSPSPSPCASLLVSHTRPVSLITWGCSAPQNENGTTTPGESSSHITIARYSAVSVHS